MATAASRVSAASPPPIAISSTARGRRCAPIWQARRPRRQQPLPAVSLMCGTSWREAPDMAQPFERRVVASDGRAPFTVDLAAQRISGPGGGDIAFDIAPAERMRLLEGLDDIGLTLKQDDEITAWEKRTAVEQPWLQTARDS